MEKGVSKLAIIRAFTTGSNLNFGFCILPYVWFVDCISNSNYFCIIVKSSTK